MDIAQAMYLGGETIQANSPWVNSLSYLDLGLQCVYCGEPVHSRRGEVNQPHFAHFPTTDSNKYAECELRQEALRSGSSIQSFWWHEYRGKGQRFALFQQHFINIIRVSIPELATLSFDMDISRAKLSELQIAALEFARKNEAKIFKYVDVFFKQKSSLERAIICEAFRYLTVRSSEEIFEEVSRYLMQTAQSSESNQTLNDSDICRQILELLARVSWIDSLGTISRSRLSIIPIRTSPILTLIQPRHISQNLYIYLKGTSLCLGEANSCLMLREIKLLSFDYSEMSSAGWAARRTERPILKIREPQETFRIIPDSSLYKTFETKIHELVFSKIYKNIQQVSRKFYFGEKQLGYVPSLDEIQFTKSSLDFLATGEAEIKTKIRNKRICLAKVVIEDAALGYQYRFNNSVILFSDEYSLYRDEDPEIEDAVGIMIQEIHGLLTPGSSGSVVETVQEATKRHLKNGCNPVTESHKVVLSAQSRKNLPPWMRR